MGTINERRLDDIWDLVDIPFDKALLTQDYAYSRIFALSSAQHGTHNEEINALTRELNGRIGLTLYSHLVESRTYSHLVLRNSAAFRIPRRQIRAKGFSEVLERHVTAREAELTKLTGRYKHLFSQPVSSDALRCFLGFIFSSHVTSPELFTLDKRLLFNSNGEIRLESGGKDPHFRPLNFYLVSALDAPYSPDFWESLWRFDKDFSCIVSIDRIDETFAQSLLRRTRNIYHATKRESKFPVIASCFRYSTTFLFPAENYDNLQYFLEHLRFLGCNVAVQCVKAEETLANALPPGRVFGECATDRPELLFTSNSSRGPQKAEKRTEKQQASSLPKDPHSPAIQIKGIRNQPLYQKWPLISYDEPSGSLITDRHDFCRIYSIDSFWDPHLCPVNYPGIDRALNTLADNHVSLTMYLLRSPIDPVEATSPLMHEQLVHLRNNNLAFKTKLYAVMNYKLQEKTLKTIYQATHDEMQKQIQERLDTVDREMKAGEEAFNILTRDRLSGDRLLEFFNPFLHSNVHSLEHFLQDPFSNHYLSEYICDSDLDVRGKYVYLGGRYYGTIVVLDYPMNFRSDFWKCLLQSYPKGDFSAVVKLRGLTSSEQETMLRRRQRIFYSARTTGLTGVPDPRADLQAQQMEEAQLQQYAKGERIFDSQVIFLQSAESPEQLESNQNELLSKCRLLGLSPLRPLLGTGALFFSCLPPAQIYKSFNRRTSTRVATHLLPLHLTMANQDLKNSDVCFVDRTGTPDGFKLFDVSKPNNHGCLSGSSGEGKTMLGEWLLESHLCRNPGETSVTIIDLGVVQGGSYKRMVQEFGGEYWSLDYNTEVGFDVMARLRTMPEDKTELNFVAYMIEQMTSDPKARSDGHTGIRITQSEAFELLQAFTSNVGSIKDITLENFMRSYSLYAEFRECQGRLKNFFFNHKNVDLTSPLVCFDFQSLSRDSYLVSLLAYFLMQNVWLSVADISKYKYKVLLVDELGLIIDNPMIASWLEQMIRAGRKAGLAVWLISQQLNDLAKSAHAPALVDNCSESFAMKQGYSDLMLKLHITPEDWQEISPISEPKVFSEFLRSAYNVNRLYVPPSYFQRRHTNYLDRFMHERGKNIPEGKKEEVTV